MGADGPKFEAGEDNGGQNCARKNMGLPIRGRRNFVFIIDGEAGYCAVRRRFESFHVLSGRGPCDSS